MRKLILFLLCLPIVGYSQIDPVNIGTTANDGTGDPLRTAFQKLNANDLYLQNRIDSVDLKDGVFVASGTDTYIATVTPAFNSYYEGQKFTIKFTNANTGASTINLNSKGAVPIVKEGGAALDAEDIKAGEIKLLVYDGTSMQIVGGGGGSSYTFGNGLTENDGVVGLGGTLNNGVTEISVPADGVLRFKPMTEFFETTGKIQIASPVSDNDFIDISSDGLSLSSGAHYTSSSIRGSLSSPRFKLERATGQVLQLGGFGNSTTGNRIEMSGNTLSSYAQVYEWYNSFNEKFMEFDTNFPSINYANDYSSYYTDRSLIDKGFADNAYWKTSGTTALTGDATINGGDNTILIGSGDVVAQSAPYSYIKTYEEFGEKKIELKTFTNSSTKSSLIMDGLGLSYVSEQLAYIAAKSGIQLSTGDFNVGNHVGMQASASNPFSFSSNGFFGSSTPGYTISLLNQSNVTPQIGFGTGIRFLTEAQNNNHEAGMYLESVMIDNTPASEDFAFVVKLMTDGAPATEKFRVTSTGRIIVPTIPTSCTGEQSGTIWSDGGTLKICP